MKSLSSVEPCIPLTLSRDGFKSFFTNTIVSLRFLSFPTIITNVLSSTAALEVSLEPELYYDCLFPVVSSKPLTCILDPACSWLSP